MIKNIDYKLNNDGLSLVELIIVLAIIAIIGAASYLSLSMATNRQVSSCADKLRTSLEQTRNLALGKSGAYLEVWKDGTIKVQMYVDNDQPYGNEVSIGVPGIDVYYNTTLATDQVLGSTHVRVEFDRSNGGVKTFTVPGGGGGSTYVTSFRVTNDNRTCIVKIDHFTGRISVQNS